MFFNYFNVFRIICFINEHKLYLSKVFRYISNFIPQVIQILIKLMNIRLLILKFLINKYFIRGLSSISIS